MRRVRVGERHVGAKDARTCLPRAAGGLGQATDFRLLLPAQQGAAAAKRFLRNARSQLRTAIPRTITFGKNPACPRAATDMKRADQPWRSPRLRQCKRLDDVVEQGHRRIDRPARPEPGFGAWRIARRAVSGPEATAMIRKQQARNIGRSGMGGRAAFVADPSQVDT